MDKIARIQMQQTTILACIQRQQHRLQIDKIRIRIRSIQSRMPTVVSISSQILTTDATTRTTRDVVIMMTTMTTTMIVIATTTDDVEATIVTTIATITTDIDDTILVEEVIEVENMIDIDISPPIRVLIRIFIRKSLTF